ncbi:hypothetical protein G6F56_009366 [Rhizopus delemar]|nr:hypothetical protein G6F56_009366 [Rhizopus delemar]
MDQISAETEISLLSITINPLFFALVLSGSSTIYTDIWHPHLLSRNIRTWHDHTFPNSLVYLGFPLYSSITQRDSFLDKLLSKVSTACKTHSQRSLSVRGRATVVNTLILSTLWHVLRVTSTPLSFLDKICSCIAKFLTSGIFPRLSFDTMCQPREIGGLGVLDPSKQQRALQMGWLVPLLLPTHLPSDPKRALRRSFVLPRIAHFVLSHLCPDSTSTNEWDYRLLLLFSDLRGSLSGKAFLSLSLLSSAVDFLPREWSHVVVNSATMLSLPVIDLTSNPSSTVVPKSFHKLRGANTFIQDNGTNLPRARHRFEMGCFPNLCMKFINMLSHSHLTLAPFVLRTFSSPLVLLPSDTV